MQIMPIAIPVVVVTYNAEKHLPNWLDAVDKMKEASKAFDVIPCIVDNGSWDRTPGIIWTRSTCCVSIKKTCCGCHQTTGLCQHKTSHSKI